MSVAGLLLAAGAGRRLGTPKALVEWDGETFAARALRLLADGGCDPLLVVLGAAHEQVRATVDLPASVVADEWESGMGASLRAGLAALPGEAQACVVALVDTPRVGPEAVRRLVAAWESGAVAAVATYGGRPRNPVLLDRSVWAEVAALATGDAGARTWVRAHPDRVTAVDCDGTGEPDDVDTPDDLAALAAGPDPRRVHSA